MNSKTKIIVIHMKELIIAGIAIVCAIIALIAIILLIISNNNTNSKPSSTSTSLLQDTEQKNVVYSYTPGVYTASVTIDGNPLDVQVTVDKNNINSIELVHKSSEITTMYPLLEDNFNALCDAIIEVGYTEHISYDSENTYTTTILIEAITQALDKCIIKE